jgi:glycerophosphoryl diester phosphodiesterase
LRIIAHRGASAEAPENTLAAFRRAIALGVGMIELDARLTRDGVAVVIHDETLSRTTDGEGRVAEVGFAELRKCSAGAWFGPRFRDERVPRLAEVFDLVRDRAEINVEIKAEQGPPEETARAALAVSREAGALGRSLFSCFDPAALQALRREGEDIRLALLTGPSSFSRLYELGSPEAARKVLERMERWRDLALEAACVHRTLASRRLVDDLHPRGWAVHVFTVDEEVAAERLEAMGVDGIFTNDPGRLLRRWPPGPSGARR